ncbi:nuclear transport factor 2 family protein [Sphaerisporangium corydalis]|uniref:Nuclear transport factor 2 family protein n=1 Tax=Sphaerisporangium corydalis TaxID=1441875 RepID=A0ABV9ENQ4_9ACTN|nr:nuclear transport factor 2 family protein [Sphaerisporangium corydalis]
MHAQAVVERFFAAFYSGDVDAARETITQDFTLAGPFASARGPGELFQLGKGLLRIVRGHEVSQWVVEGDNVAALYEIMLQGPAGVSPLTTGGWFTVTDGRVSSGRLIYDSAAFEAIVSGS